MSASQLPDVGCLPAPVGAGERKCPKRRKPLRASLSAVEQVASERQQATMAAHSQHRSRSRWLAGLAAAVCSLALLVPVAAQKCLEYQPKTCWRVAVTNLRIPASVVAPAS